MLPCSAFPLRCTMWQRRTSSVRTHGLHSERKAPKAPTTARAVSTDRCIDKPDSGSSHFHGAPDRKKCLRHHRAIHDLRLGKFRSFFSQPPFFMPFGTQKMYKKYHPLKQKVNFWVISRSLLHKILQIENFCGIIYEETNIQARGSTPPQSINRNRQHRTDCLD